MRFMTNAEIAEDNANAKKGRMATARDKLAEKIVIAYVSGFGFKYADTIVDSARTLAARLQEANEGPGQ